MDVESMLTGWNGIVTAAIAGVVHAVKLAFADKRFEDKLNRFLPLLPIILGAVAGLSGLVEVDTVTAATTARKITAGILLGTVSMAAFKVGKTTVLGKGLESADKPAVEKES